MWHIAWQGLAAAGAVGTLLFIIASFYALYLWARGISPALFRLGQGLSRRKIAIFAKGENASSIWALLVDSGLFAEKNLCVITKAEDIGKAESATIFLLYWPDWADQISSILSRKRDKCPLIVYAPYDKGGIPKDRMSELDGQRHTCVTNFRGRLLNDIVVAMITTGYEKG